MALITLLWEGLDYQGRCDLLGWIFSSGSAVKNSPAMQKMEQKLQVRVLGWKEPLKKEMAIHSSILPWKIPWP